MSFVSTLTYPLIAASSLIPDTMLAETIAAAVANRADAEPMREALIVRLSNLNPAHTPTMFSQRVIDTLSDADPSKRLSYTVAPFSPVTGGGGCIVIAQDEHKEPYILLGRKAGHAEWSVPAGFMNPISAASPLGVYTEDTEAREPYEVNHMHGRPIAGQPIQKLTEKTPEFDHTLLDTAIRELREETALVVRPDQLELVKNLTATGEQVSPHGAQTFQQIVNFYLADLRAQGALPIVQPQDDLPELAWIKLKDIQPSPLFPPIIENAVAQMREKELAAHGVTKDAVAAYMAKTGQPKPLSELGAEAIAWHEKALHAAQTMGWTLVQMTPDQKPGHAL